MFKVILISAVDTTKELIKEATCSFNLLSWFEVLSNFWQGLIITLIGALVVFLIGLPFKWWKKLWNVYKAKRDITNAKYLTDYRSFYGDELERHKYNYVLHREEIGEKEVVVRDVLTDIEIFLKSNKTVLLLIGTAGMGKSRILVELAKRHHNLKLVNTRDYKEEMERLKVGLEQTVRDGDILICDDCQDYSGYFPIFLGIFRKKKTKLIVASRYRESVKDAIYERRLSCELIELRPMKNVSEIIQIEEKIANEILRISEGNPAIAVMAFEHFKRRDTLKGITDSFHLMKEVLEDLVQAGKDVGCQNSRLFLAEVAVRAGLWDTDVPLKQNFEMVKRLKIMGHIIAEQRRDRRIYYIVPDILRDYIIREVFFSANEVSPEFKRLIERIPPEDAINVVWMLGIQYQETDEEVYKWGCVAVLEKFQGMPSAPKIGFEAEPGKPQTEVLLELGLEAYDWFGDYRLVTDILGDFCVDAEKIESSYYAGRAGGFYYRTGNPTRAKECWNRALTLTQEAGDKLNEAVSLHNLAMIQQDQGNYSEAEKLYQQSLKLTEELGDKSGIAITLHQLGTIQQLQGNYSEAEKLYQQSLKLTEELGDKSGIATTLHQLAIIQQHQGNYSEAEKLYQQSLKLAEELGDKSGIAITLHQLAIIQQLQGNYSEAEKLYQQSLKLKKELGDKSGIAITLHQLGTIQELQGNYSEAEKLYQQSLKLTEELGDKSGIAKTLHQLGTIQQLQGNYSEAEKLYQQSLKLKKELGDKSGIATTLHQLGMIQQDQGNYSEAEKLYQQSLKLKKELGDKSGIATTLGQLGRLAETRGDDAKALGNYLIALTIFKELQSPYAKFTESLITKMQARLGKAPFQKLHQEVLENLKTEGFEQNKP